MDFIRINAAEEEGHCAAETKGTSSNVFRSSASVTRDGEDSSTKETCNHGTGHGSFGAILIKVHVEQSRSGGIVLSEMNDTT